MEYFLLIIGAMFVNNFVLCQFLGCCPFLGVSKKTDTALGMGLAVIFVMGIASVFTWLVQKLLVAAGIEYLQTIVFILVIAALVQTVELLLKRFMPALYSALGVYLPLITTNCAVLGVAILNIQSFGTVGAGVHHRDTAARGHTREDGSRGGAQAVQGIPHHAHSGVADEHGVHRVRGDDLVRRAA